MGSKGALANRTVIWAFFIGALLVISEAIRFRLFMQRVTELVMRYVEARLAIAGGSNDQEIT